MKIKSPPKKCTRPEELSLFRTVKALGVGHCATLHFLWYVPTQIKQLTQHSVHRFESNSIFWNKDKVRTSMISSKKVASAVGGKTARACDSCITKRARWYCAADDAFLCQACDSSVHSANPLARRHERVRLKTGSFKPSDHGCRHVGQLKNSAPSWYRGFTKKARTPRHGRYSTNHQTSKSEDEEELAARSSNPFYLVPEVISDENLSHEENEEQLLYRVPIFDPFMSKLCTHQSSANSAENVVARSSANNEEVGIKGIKGGESKPSSAKEANGMVDTLHMFIHSDIELAEFAADVESLLGRGLEDECIGMEELGLRDTKEEDSRECSVGSAKVKVEDEVANEETGIAVEVEADQMNMARESFEFSFDYDSLATCEEEEEKLHLPVTSSIQNGGEGEGQDVKKKILLNLDYEAVITAWATSQRSSPWTNGDRPNIDLNECWPHCMGTCGIEVHHPYADFGGLGCHPAMLDGGREARVSRYREKRRTRLFSKKIRYEVRKLNAEKRPRMKGRFIKRASFTGSGFPLLNK